MCNCIDWYYVIAQICIVIFFQILMYKLGCKQGEKIAYKRYLKTCNECRNKNELVGKTDKLEDSMRYTPFENVIAVKEITQFMIAHDLPKERVIEVLDNMISMIDKKPNYYFSRENIEYLKQIIIKNDR